MVQGVKKYKKKEYLFAILTIVIFLVLLNKYIINGVRTNLDSAKFQKVLSEVSSNLTKKEELVCGEDQREIFVADGKLCRDKVERGEDESRNNIYVEIYDTYPKHGNGKELVYDFFDEGDIAIANAYLKNEIQIERYDPFNIETDKITWEEDPYNERYWRSIFYSLRDTRHLLYAYRETGDDKYKDKLTEIIEGFLDEGTHKPHAWDDYHAVAFRAMTLTNTWWKLRESDALPIELSNKILESLERHGDFLFNETHYESKNNNGISQAAALLLISVNFPDINSVYNWNLVAKSRIVVGITDLVNENGILVENSPYYHFYALEKYWNIYEYFKKNDMKIDTEYKERLDKMVSYATYVLQPNLEIPLIGVSLERYIGNSGAFEAMSKEYPEFLYVLTQGRKGEIPQELNRYYPSIGQAIMRSAWDNRTKFDNNFEEQTQLIFDAGSHEKSHSDLNALSFNLYSKGSALITDKGLYINDTDKASEAYFQGTKRFNTILVDGKNQVSGAPIQGEFKEGDGYVLHSAQHKLYPLVYHQRSMILLDDDLVVIVDRLISDKDHDYEQLFHVAPNMKVELNKENEILARDMDGNIKLSIHQFLSDEMEANINKEKKVPYETISYKKHSKNESFITLLKFGDNKDKILFEAEGENNLKIKSSNKTYHIELNKIEAEFFDNFDIKKEVTNEYLFDLSIEEDQWKLNGEGSENFRVEPDSKGNIAIFSKAFGETQSLKKPSYAMEIEDVDVYYSINEKISSDIPIAEDSDSYRVYEQEDYLPILGYHHILSDNDEIKSPLLEMHVSDFEKQINYMTNVVGCRWFTFGDIMEDYILKELKTPKNACVMNFDDGRKDHFTNGYETFERYGAVATFYVITDQAAGDKDSYMDFSDLDILYRNGNEIGSHTVNAGGLVVDSYDEEELIYQLEKSRKSLEEQGYKVTTFAYPRGEQNDEIVNLAKKTYIAGRDTSKDNNWRDVRPSTVSFDEDYVWHMNYYKPELDSSEKLNEKIGYNTWWQFEEGKRVDYDLDGDVRDLSSYDPTENSYAVVELSDIGDRISNKFIVSNDDDYNLEIFITVNTEKKSDFSKKDTVNIYVDDNLQKIKEESMDECVLYDNQYYCLYTAFVNLEKGVHVLSIEATSADVKADKFRMYREFEMKNSYNIKLKEIETILPKEHPDQIEVSIRKGVSQKTWIIASVVISLTMLGLGFLVLLKYKTKK